MGCSKIHGGLAAQAGYPIELNSTRGIDFQSIKKSVLYDVSYLYFFGFQVFTIISK